MVAFPLQILEMDTFLGDSMRWRSQEKDYAKPPLLPYLQKIINYQWDVVWLLNVAHPPIKTLNLLLASVGFVPPPTLFSFES